MYFEVKVFVLLFVLIQAISFLSIPRRLLGIAPAYGLTREYVPVSNVLGGKTRVKILFGYCNALTQGLMHTQN